MGKVKAFSIVFKNNRQVYAPGDVVEGTVNIDLKKQRKIKKINVICLGQCEVKVKKDSDILRNTEKYFEYNFDVYSGDTELSTGVHKFPFQVQLPPNIPTSFEGGAGHVRYSIQSTIEYSGLLGGKTKCMIAFTVLGTVDLNLMPEVRQPVRLFCERKSSGALFWKKSEVSVNLSVDKRGFVSGEAVRLTGIISNGSTKPLKNFKVTLTQKVIYFGRNKNASQTSTPDKCEVSKVVATGEAKDVIYGNKSLVWERSPLLQIPALVPSGLKHCTIINVEYFLEVSTMIQGSIGGEYIRCQLQPITIGSIPLFTQAPPINPAQPSTLMPSAPPLVHDMGGFQPPVSMGVSPNAPPPYDISSAPPLPSYEEAVTGGASLNDSVSQSDQDEIMSNNIQFTPQYAVYTNWDGPPSATNPSYMGQ